MAGLLEAPQKRAQLLQIFFEQQPAKCWTLAQQLRGSDHRLGGAFDLLARQERGLTGSGKCLLVGEPL
jgi:hypothetical protein